MPGHLLHIGDHEGVVTPGVVDEAAVELYSNGACWYLAWVLHQLTGYPMVTFGGFLFDADSTYEWRHAAVLTPDRQVIDITGTNPLDEIAADWLDGDTSVSQADVYPLPVEDFDRVIGYDPAAVDPLACTVTYSIARTLLAQHQLAS